MQVNPITVQTADGFSLSATHFALAETLNPTTEWVVVINNAMGVKQRYYQAFASFLASQGHEVYTYDFRGLGASKVPKITQLKSNASTWAGEDFRAMLLYVKQMHPQKNIAVVGHSFGGQIVGFNASSDMIKKALLVASQSGYWQHWTGKGRWGMYAMSHLLLPMVCRLMGYLPAQMGMGADLPKNVAMEWAKWCRSKQYLFDHLSEEQLSRYKNFEGSILSLNFTDDGYAPRKSVEAFLDFFPKTNVETHFISPEEIGVSSIGHFGFFRSQYESTLWQRAKQWLEN
ncbi:MAG: alpha/beta fold hydrolase [Cytophagales bacterium]|nr:MAG: alpha/beta fold hydrolase [Cytophagales bacterium]